MTGSMEILPRSGRHKKSFSQCLFNCVLSVMRIHFFRLFPFSHLRFFFSFVDKRCNSIQWFRKILKSSKWAGILSGLITSWFGHFLPLISFFIKYIISTHEKDELTTITFIKFCLDFFFTVSQFQFSSCCWFFLSPLPSTVWRYEYACSNKLDFFVAAWLVSTNSNH